MRPALRTLIKVWCALFANDASTLLAWVWFKTHFEADHALVLLVLVYVNLRFRLFLLGLLLFFLDICSYLFLFFLGMYCSLRFSIDVNVAYTLKFMPKLLTKSRVMWEVASSSMETSFSKSEKLADYCDVLLARLFPFLIYVLKSAFIAKFAVSSGIVPANPILHFFDVIFYNNHW